jgi:uncharacterized protein (TIGR03118 family)
MHTARFVSRARLMAMAIAVPASALIGAQQVLSAGAAPPPGTYSQTNLVSDVPGQAAVTDPHLVNPWGMASSPTSPIWVSDNGAGVATLYDGNGVPFPPGSPLVVQIPAPKAAGPGSVSAPTGQVFNPTPDFTLTKKGTTAPSLFIFSTEDGTIAGWNPTIELHHAVIKADRSAATDPAGDIGAVYKGLALASTEDGSNFLYATNFRFGVVDMFDSKFHLVRSFTDPKMRAGFAPFGIHTIGGNLYVTFAKQNAEKHDDVGGPGNGFIDVFSPAGDVIHRIVSHGSLNSPWAVTLAPSTFGAFGGDLLVGNFGDGRVTAYNATDQVVGQLHDPAGKAISIPGLWDLRFGNGAHDEGVNSLYFTAGIDGEAHGLFGDLNPN